LVIATGSVPNKFGWPGQDLPGVQGLYSWQDLEHMERDTRGIDRAVIVGGGLIGVEMAEMLRSRNIEVSFLVREGAFWGNILPEQEAALITRHIREHHVDLRPDTELDEILEGPDGRVRGVRTKGGEEIQCGFVGLTAGVRPNIDWMKESPDIATDRGVLVNEFLETNVPDIHAIGDCAQFAEHPDPDRKSVEQVWYTGRMMGETVAMTLTGDRTPYRPGIWFNSAKFFDIEYQTYGWVRSTLQKGMSEHYWEHPGGRIAVHMVWATGDRTLQGINVFGLRLRHGVLDRWLRERATVDHVVEHFSKAGFDPEFQTAVTGMVQHSFRSVNRITA
ncbi:MAG: FAD-dependent oxidoreductase, partial [Flavobacteriales bacterium]|nr:FAD-dependent oxidoreductase [Flavobacteriales bacterium]